MGRSRAIRNAAALPVGDPRRRRLLAQLRSGSGDEVAIAEYAGKHPQTGASMWRLVNSTNPSDIGTKWAMTDRADTSVPQLVTYYPADQFVYPVPLSKVRV